MTAPDAGSRTVLGYRPGMLKDRKVIALGERDGVSGTAIKAVAEAAGGSVLFNATECFV